MLKNNKIVLSAKDISVEFQVRNRTLRAIRNISVDLHDGETLALVGESGSGKSVFTKVFTGMLEANGRVSTGEVDYGDLKLTDFKTNAEWENVRGSEISTIFQDPMTSLNPIKTIGSQISETIIKHQKKSKEEAKAIAVDLMERVGITDAAKRYDEYPFQYSGGMRQRIVIAIALASRPKVLICDEPTTALDVTIQAQIIALLKELKEEYGFAMIFITHDLGVVASIADKVAVMYAGEIIEYGSVEDIFYDSRHPYTWALLSSLPQLATSSKLYSIAGTPPSLYTEIKGDAFAPRNPQPLAIDFENIPPKFEVSETHWAKTWLLDERAPELPKPEGIQDLHAKMTQIYAKTDEKGAKNG
jgi:oligopeptide transport system ATP-binding protein